MRRIHVEKQADPEQDGHAATQECSIVPPNNVKARAGVLGGREVANGAEEGRGQGGRARAGQGQGLRGGKREGQEGKGKARARQGQGKGRCEPGSLGAWYRAGRGGAGCATLLAAPFKEGTALVPCLGTVVATGTARDRPPISPRLRLQRHRPGPGECEGASYMPALDEHHHHSPIPGATTKYPLNSHYTTLHCTTLHTQHDGCCSGRLSIGRMVGLADWLTD
ncbi:hypothetical protein COCMIDRAFT_26820 [Bipolaris oryzae ATCC 44560]|uniref:Uncharacterized protein n=1 Tax=Bipolaris oryzae ATCC 44560 TaxID=930090 RepID=W6Z4Q4_COCMI|nr:uncharacterized protein COCMIDRAFT_26820 [Bipolaris oryzae ATCC 44560]EUC44960.1 hypothetical protein COCMIDRAFT_26820 [Bipolaris oryzae ATCC 44560]